MNIFNKVTLQSLKKNKTRTAVTVIGIILSAAMICAVTTFASSFQNYLVEYAVYTDGDWHGSACDADNDTYGSIAASDKVENAVYFQQLGYALTESKNESKPYIYLLGASEGLEDVLPIQIYEGDYPESSREILLPAHLESNGGVAYSIGDTVTLDLGLRMIDGWSMNQYNPYQYTQDGDDTISLETLEIRETRTYTVVGFYARPSFEEYTSPGYTAITLADEGLSENYLYDVYFKMKKPGDVFSFMEDNGFSGSRNTDLLMYQGVSRYGNFMTMLYSLIAIVLGLIMFGSVSLIYNAFSISVSERTKQFGLLSSVGATKKQLRSMVLFEAFAVSAVGIPIGIVSGVAGIGVTLMLIGHKFRALGIPLDLTLNVSLVSIAAAVAVSVITVLISAFIPSLRATRVSAVEAIRQNLDVKAKSGPVKTSKLTYRLFGLPGVLASKHYKRSKKKYRTTVLSLFMSIVLFISASAFSSYLMTSVTGGFQSFGYDLRCYYSDDGSTEYSKDDVLAFITDSTAVTDAAYTRYMFVNGRYDAAYLTDDAVNGSSGIYTETEDGTTTALISTYIYFVNDSEYLSLLDKYGLDRAVFYDPGDPTGIAFDGAVRFDYQKEKYVEMNLLANGRAEAVFEYEAEIDGYAFTGTEEAEDGSTLYRFVKNGSDDEFVYLTEDQFYYSGNVKAGKVLYEYPYFMDIRGGVTLLYPDSMKSAVFGDDYPMRFYEYYVKSSDHAQSYTAIKNALSDKGIPSENIYDYAADVENSRNLITIIRVFSYGFIVLISLIAAANVFNTVSTNISLRRREFAMLKSVGMSAKGFNRMMNYECLLYGSRALILGLPVSVGVTYLIYMAITNGYYTAFTLPWGAMGIAVLSVFAVVFATMLYSMSKIKKDNPIDALKNENL